MKLPDKRDASIFVWSEYKPVKVVFSEILYIESRKDYVCFFIKEGKTLLSLMTLKELAERLPENKFVRVHRSYILTEILYMTSGMLDLVSSIQIPMGNPYKESIKLIFNK